MSRWLMMLLGVSLLVLVGVAPYPAYVVTLDRAPAEVRVGVPFEVGFSIQPAEGAAPASRLAPLVVATNTATREQVKVAARPDSAPGHFEALLILPAAGRWQWEIYPEGQDGETPVVMSPLTVGDAGEGWLQSSLTLALLALLAAAVGVGLAAGRLARRVPVEVEYVRR
jgi:hypothetical protein